MKISTKGRYALRLMLDLAENAPESCVSLRDISARQNISIKYLEQIVSLLCKSGLLISIRGAQGGYMPVSYTHLYPDRLPARREDRPLPGGDLRKDTEMNLIVAVDEDWGIGYKGDLLARVRADLQNFRRVTEGKIVVLGSNTLATFPGGRVLKNRTNIVLNWEPDYAPEGATVVHSLDELFDELKKYDTDDVFVIGGASVYRQLLPYCRKAVSYTHLFYLPGHACRRTQRPLRQIGPEAIWNYRRRHR